MANTLKFGNGTWATKKGSTLAYNDENNNFKPLPFTTTRDSGATRVNKEGLIEVVSNDVPRIDYTDSVEGVLLLENSATNLVTYSEALSNWTQDGASTVDNLIISPDGTQNASKINFNSGDKRIYLSVSTSSAYFSGYFKGIKGKKIRFRDNSNLVFNEITLTEDWVRYEFNKSTSNTNIQIQGIDADYVYAWGIQAEENSVVSSYIPTNGSTVTRLADTASGSGNSEVFNDSEGVLFADIAALDDDLTYRSISIGAGVGVINLFYNNVSNTIVASSAGGALIIKQLSDITNFNKVIFKYKQNDFSLWVNGFEIGTDTSGTTGDALTTLSFDNNSGGSRWYGKTKELGYYDTALTDEELEYLTSYRSLNELATELNLNTL